jgi:sulfur carrier protein ThiS
MKVEVNLYASLAQYVPPTSDGKSFVMELSEGTRIRDALAHLKVPGEAVKIIFLNGIHATADTVLRNGDRLGVFPPVAGG